LFTSTLQCYFEGRKELFTGLAMERLETEWVKHPVLRFDFGGLKTTDIAELKERLSDMLAIYETIYGMEVKGKSIGGRFANLIRKAYEQSGRRVALLVDEYDAPILQALMQPDKIEEVRHVMRDFYSQIKPSNEYLRFVFLTGISTFSQLGMFSELNNLFHITDVDEYAAVCGITPQELTDNFQYGIHDLAKSMDCTPDEVVNMLREKYDGYHFTSSLTDVFNPYSLLSAFAGRKLGDYWFQTGTPTLAIDMLREHKGQWKFDMEEIENLPPTVFSAFSTPLEQAHGPLPFLYQAGYLTIKDYYREDDLYVLGVPNTEVRRALTNNLFPHYSA
jgi:hypothetical protein